MLQRSGLRRPNAHDATLYPLRCAQATWYNVGLGACGYTDKNSDAVVALAQPNWGGGSHCNQVRSTPFLAGFCDTLGLITLSLGQKIQITNPKNGKVSTATVRDLCPGCGSGSLGQSRPPLGSTSILISLLPSRLDLSPSLFTTLFGSTDLGVAPMTWTYV
jgi:hypothetical protein